ncbi:hypothetical protein ColLi_10409 [Colletotrichum liriopes]|uniref:Rhodopsin domain-containing protein n=1 Tax=Colletotrichum liriopes TaxID=708192 RepID=A0AA37GUM1_9PEZI|nr:hypothetical protein ColLi_10409 [Colletotrichum liriopes]
MASIALSHGGLNVALDVWMLVLPAVQIWGLNMRLREKLGYMSMFCLGFFLLYNIYDHQVLIVQSYLFQLLFGRI